MDKLQDSRDVQYLPTPPLELTQTVTQSKP